MNRKKLFNRLALLVFLIFVVNFVANKLYWYSSIFMFDKFMHFWGGFFVLLLVAYIFPPKNTSKRTIALLLLGVLVVGFSWEVFEYVFNNILAGIPFDVQDTLGDLFFDVFGGCIGSVYLMRNYLGSKNIA